MDDLPEGKPVSSKIKCSFPVVTLFSRLSAIRVDKEERVSFMTHTQARVNNRMTGAIRITGGFNPDLGKEVPGILDTAYGKPDTGRFSFGKNDATILPCSTKILTRYAIVENEWTKERIVDQDPSYEPPLRRTTSCTLQNAVVVPKTPDFLTEPIMTFLGEEEYNEINELCCAVFGFKLADYYDLSNPLFLSMSWNEKATLLFGALLNLLTKEFEGFSDEKEIWRYLFKLRKYLGVKWDVISPDGKYRTAHARYESKQLTQYITATTPSCLDGCGRGTSTDYCLLNRQSDTFIHGEIGVDDNSEKAYEPTYKPNYERMAEINNFHVVSYAAKKKPVEKNKSATKKGKGQQDTTVAIQPYTDSELLLLQKFSLGQQAKNQHSSSSNLCHQIHTLALDYQSTHSKRVYAYLFRNPQFMLCEYSKDWAEIKFKIDIGVNMQDATVSAKHKTCFKDKLYCDLLRPGEYQAPIYHDVYDWLYITSPDKVPKEGDKQKIHPYYCTQDRVFPWIVRLTHEIIWKLKTVDDPGFQNNFKNMMLENVNSPDSIFVNLGMQEELLSTTLRKIHARLESDKNVAFVLLWNILVNSLSYYPSLPSDRQPIDGLIALAGCAGTPPHPILHEPSQYNEAGNHELIYAKHITYPDGIFDPLEREAREVPSRISQLQVSIGVIILRIDYGLEF